MSILYKLSTNFVRLDRALILSPVWHSLSGAAMRVYLVFRSKVFWKEDRKKGVWYISNNGELEFSYHEARERYGIWSRQFKKGLAELVEKGLLDIKRPGEPHKKVTSLYAISDRWRKWGQGDFQAAKMRKRRAKGGFHKQKQKKPIEAVKLRVVNESTFPESAKPN